MILHCMKKETWEKVKVKKYYGEKNLERDGFIHCSSVENFWRVAPNFKDVTDELVLLCIDEDEIESEVRWEDLYGGGINYPHIYGLINLNAVKMVLPYQKDKDGNWIKNDELKAFQNK